MADCHIDIKNVEDVISSFISTVLLVRGTEGQPPPADGMKVVVIPKELWDNLYELADDYVSALYDPKVAEVATPKWCMDVANAIIRADNHKPE